MHDKKGGYREAGAEEMAMQAREMMEGRGGREKVEVVHTLREGVCGEFQMSAEDRTCARVNVTAANASRSAFTLLENPPRGHLRVRSLAHNHFLRITVTARSRRNGR